MKGLVDILHKIEIGEKSITNAYTEICSLFSTNSLFPTDEEADLKAFKEWTSKDKTNTGKYEPQLEGFYKYHEWLKSKIMMNTTKYLVD